MGDSIVRLGDLRARAARQLRARPEAQPARSRRGPPEAKELAKLVHELDVQRVELELQNEELRTTQQALIQTRNYFATLFEHAPVGYLCVDGGMLVQRANQTAADMLAQPCSRIVGRAMSSFVSPSSLDTMYAHRHEVLRSGSAEVCQLVLQTASNEPFPVKAVSLAAPPALDLPRGFQMVLVDLRSSIAQQAPVAEPPAPGESHAELERLRLALRTLAEELVAEEERIEQFARANIERLVLPLVSQLRERSARSENAAFDALERALRSLTSGYVSALTAQNHTLTNRELQVCDLIRCGLSSKDIARVMARSPQSVDVHRKHIRKKLGLTRTGDSLTATLRSLDDKSTSSKER